MDKTGSFWDRRAESDIHDQDVNIADRNQREVELAAITPYLSADMEALEVGCGNGYSTSRFRKLVRRIDAFDYSKPMVDRAKRTFGETNNRFFVDNIVVPRHLIRTYDIVICVRVLINLRSLEEQLAAIKNFQSLVKNNGKLILLEGFLDGFSELNAARAKQQMGEIEPANQNSYCFVSDILPKLENDFSIEEEFHLGSYDYLTRVVYPTLIAPDQVKHNTQLHEKFRELAINYNPDCFKGLSRTRGFIMSRRAI